MWHIQNARFHIRYVMCHIGSLRVSDDIGFKRDHLPLKQDTLSHQICDVSELEHRTITSHFRCATSPNAEV